MAAEGEGQQEFWLILSQAPGLGAVGIARLQTLFGSVEAVCAASDAALAQAGLKSETRAAIRKPSSAVLEASLSWASQSSDRVILTPGDLRYPRQVLELPAPTGSFRVW